MRIFIRVNLHIMGNRQGRLVVTVPAGEITDDGDVQVTTDIQHNFIDRLAERDFAVAHFQHLTDHKTLDLIQDSAAFHMQHHAVKGIEFFIDFFQKQDRSTGVDLVFGTQPFNHQGEIAAPQRATGDSRFQCARLAGLRGPDTNIILADNTC